jgi:hypothetical protein
MFARFILLLIRLDSVVCIISLSMLMSLLTFVLLVKHARSRDGKATQASRRCVNLSPSARVKLGLQSTGKLSVMNAWHGSRLYRRKSSERWANLRGRKTYGAAW